MNNLNPNKQFVVNNELSLQRLAAWLGDKQFNSYRDGLYNRHEREMIGLSYCEGEQFEKCGIIIIANPEPSLKAQIVAMVEEHMLDSAYAIKDMQAGPPQQGNAVSESLLQAVKESWLALPVSGQIALWAMRQINRDAVNLNEIAAFLADRGIFINATSAMSQLFKSKLVERVGRGKYKLPSYIDEISFG